MYNNGRRKRGEPECNEYNIQEERKTLQYFCGHAIEQYERGKMPEAEIRFGLTKLFTLLETIGKDFKPLVRRQPQDFTIRLDSSFYAQRARNDLTTRGYEGIVESIDALPRLCGLLTKSENHLQVKSRQRGQKPVQTRTIADMTNEMEGEFTELPKYIAYAKVLQGKEMWKGRIETHPLTDEINTPPKYIKAITNDLGCTRKEIEEAIRTRQENWRPKIEVVGEIEPEVPKVGEKKWAKKKETKPSSKPPPTSYD